MTKFIAAFEDFFKSIYELFASIIGTFASLVNTLITTVLNFFSGIINLFLDVGKGAVDLVGGVGKFIAGKLNTLSHVGCPRMLTGCHRQHRGPRGDSCGCLRLHSSTAGKARGACEKDQLGVAIMKWQSKCWIRMDCEGSLGLELSSLTMTEMMKGSHWFSSARCLWKSRYPLLVSASTTSQGLGR